MADEFHIFISFLNEQKVNFIRSNDLISTVNLNFDLLTEELLRLLISRAIQERDDRVKNKKKSDTSSSSSTTTPSNDDDKSLLGSWGIIIDTIRDAKLKRQELAVKHISAIMSYNNDSNPQNLIRFLRELHASGKIDFVFKQILENSREECLKRNNEDSAAVYQFVTDVITRLETQAIKQQQSMAPVSNPTHAATSITTPIPAAVNNSKLYHSNDDIKKVDNVHKVDNDNDSDDCDDDDDNNNSNDDDKGYHDSDLELAGQQLNNLLNECKGDAKALKVKLLFQLQHQQQQPSQSQPAVVGSTAVNINVKAYLHVLKDNISACQQAGYVNKLKLFEFIQSIVEAYMKEQEDEQQQQRSRNGTEGEESDHLSNHHAPQFFDPINNNSNNNAHNASSSALHEYPIISPDHFINGIDFMSNLLQTNIKNMKKKNDKKVAKIKAQNIVKELSHSLEMNGWAVCDDFFSTDLVRRVRIESNLFQEYYEQSEIWIGKQSDIGAQIQVPSVRGDKVLWMCGGHNNNHTNSATGVTAPENSSGMSRGIKTYNEIEPCKLEIKTSAPIKKFMALKELINSVDKLVYSLKPHVNKLQHIYDRSDAMLAVYPSQGTRFARHIDNSTQDGRRLTVLVYLNVNWKKEDGGALRLTPRLKEYMSSSGDGDNNSNSNSSKSSSSSSATTSSSSSSIQHQSTTQPQQQQQQQQQQVIDILPIAGRVALFYSAEIPHEVMPTYNQRHAVTIWYYDSIERLQAVHQAQEKGVSATVAKSSITSQLEVKNFMAELMGGNNNNNNNNNNSENSNDIYSKTVAESSNIGLQQPKQQHETQQQERKEEETEVKQLATKVKHLSEEALMIVSSITGAPSPQSFKEGFELLTPTDLKNMRALFQRMGLQ